MSEPCCARSVFASPSIARESVPRADTRKNLPSFYV
jgi:hypothetical protein